MLFFVVLIQKKILFPIPIEIFANGLLLLVLNLFHKNLFFLLVLKILIHKDLLLYSQVLLFLVNLFLLLLLPYLDLLIIFHNRMFLFVFLIVLHSNQILHIHQHKIVQIFHLQFSLISYNVTNSIRQTVSGELEMYDKIVAYFLNLQL